MLSAGFTELVVILWQKYFTLHSSKNFMQEWEGYYLSLAYLPLPFLNKIQVICCFEY